MAEAGAPRFDFARFRRDAAAVRRGFWPKFRRLAGQLPFAEELLAAYFCATDTRTPMAVKAVLMAALAYFVLPADVIPDVVAGFGFTDDATVLLAAYRAVSRHVDDDHRERAKRLLERGQTPDGRV